MSGQGKIIKMSIKIERLKNRVKILEGIVDEIVSALQQSQEDQPANEVGFKNHVPITLDSD